MKINKGMTQEIEKLKPGNKSIFFWFTIFKLIRDYSLLIYCILYGIYKGYKLILILLYTFTCANIYIIIYSGTKKVKQEELTKEKEGKL